MALAVTHILVPIITVSIISHYFLKKPLKQFYIYLVGIAGILPDIDIPIGWVLSILTGTTINIHGKITHNIIFPLLAFAFAFIYYKLKNKNATMISLMIAIGWTFHLLLDCAFGGYAFFLPLSNINFCIEIIPKTFARSLDALLLVFWLTHEQIKHKIKSYF